MARSRPKKYRNIYESNAAQVLEHSLAHPGPRALHATRVEAEIKLVRKQGRPSTTAEVQARHNFTEAAAQKLLRAVARALRKPANSDAELLAKRKTAPTSVAKPVATTLAPRNTPDIQSNAPSIAAVPQVQLAAILADIRRRFEKEIRAKGEQTSVKEGFVYLVTHPSFEGWIKAGMTIDYEVRLATYNVADPLSRFELTAAKWVADRRDAEKQLLRGLGQTACEMRGEWARVELSDAVKVFDAI